MAKLKPDTRPLGSQRSWARTPGTYIAGQAHIDGADAVAIAMETKWGADRLRLLVPVELREKFDRQRYLLNQAIWHGDLEDVRREASRMMAAWRTLDRVATEAGAALLAPEVWELALEDGTAVALVRSPEDARAVIGQGRKLVVMTLDEIARLLSNYRAVVEAKAAFPGAKVTAVRRPSDPLENLRDSDSRLDQPFNDEIPTFGV